jgi:hypothetical protein
MSKVEDRDHEAALESKAKQESREVMEDPTLDNVQVPGPIPMAAWLIIVSK